MSRRLIWMLNHRTLMPDEVGLLRGLGWAVYTPRILPKGGRSTVVEDRLDEAPYPLVVVADQDARWGLQSRLLWRR